MTEKTESRCKPNHAEYRRQAKAAASAKLNEQGIDASESENITALVAKVVRSGLFRPRRKGEPDTQYLMRISREHIVNAAAIASAREQARFQPLQPSPHWRQAEIDAAQPPMMTPNGVGNGTERVHGYGRGS